jgi:uncharacterized protein YukE
MNDTPHETDYNGAARALIGGITAMSDTATKLCEGAGAATHAGAIKSLAEAAHHMADSLVAINSVSMLD